MIYKSGFYNFLILLFLTVQVLSAQNNYFPIRNFGPKEYGNHSSSNWCVAQDHLGLMYFGNANGILQYDGLEWRFIPVKYGSYVRTLKADHEGNIYVGCYGEFGKLKTDEKGNIFYQSLSRTLNEIDARFKDIIKINTLGDEVIFQSEERIFIYNKKGNLKVLEPESSFHTSFVVHQEFYVRQRDKGIFKLEENSLKKIEGTEIFANYGLFAMLPHGNNDILIATQDTGLFVFQRNKGKFQELVPENKSVLLKSKVYGGIQLSDGNYAFNTLNGGVYIYDQKGFLLSNVNKTMGIRDDDVKDVFEDFQNNLWLATNNGISMVSILSPLSYYGSEVGIEGSIQDVARNGDLLYLATSNGVFFSEVNSSPYRRFKKLENVSSNQFWEFTKVGEKLWVSGNEGIYEISGEQINRVYDKRCRSLVFDPFNQIWFVGSEDGIALLEKDWTFIQFIPDLDIVILKLILDKQASDLEKTIIWAGSLQYGLTRISININLETMVDYIGFPTEVTNEYIYPLVYQNQVIFASTAGLYAFHPDKRNDTDNGLRPFKYKSTESLRNVSFLREHGDDTWLIINNLIEKRNRLNDERLYKTFLPINKGQIYTLLPDEAFCWIGAHEGLIQYHYKDKSSYKQTFPLLIRSLKFGKDSLFFSGNTASIPSIINLSYTLNDFAISFAGTYFEESERNEYSWYLKGYDQAWTPWSKEYKVNYNNLLEGDYEFSIRGRNIYGAESQTLSFQFSIAPPWFRTWWAYLGYVFLFSASVIGFIRYRTRALAEEKLKLEKLVKVRTKEVVAQKDEILKQKLVVDKQHQEISDSINYAQRIQSSLIGSEKLLRKHLPDFFVLLIPRNVVSGDFYWAAPLSPNNFLLATADSTGHGVPGAIMSILNIACLKDSIEADKQTDPAEILNHTRKRIISSLAGDEEEEGGKDGMDCSLISYDFPNLRMFYAAANSPIWIVRNSENGEKELIELKPDKMPVGKFTEELSAFTQHEVKLQKGDLVYTFTDGFADQFGGSQGKKFKYKPLRALLTEIANQPLNIQKQILKDTFLKWKGDEEQTDDVCLIGVKV